MIFSHRDSVSSFFLLLSYTTRLSSRLWGHPSKLREPVLQWLKTYCQASPETPSHVVAEALEKQFGVRVSISHLNGTRAELGLTTQSRQGRKKNGMCNEEKKRSGKTGQEDSCW